jgi:hypothetical protein
MASVMYGIAVESISRRMERIKWILVNSRRGDSARSLNSGRSSYSPTGIELEIDWLKMQRTLSFPKSQLLSPVRIDSDSIEQLRESLYDQIAGPIGVGAL